MRIALLVEGKTEPAFLPHFLNTIISVCDGQVIP